jgi:phage tail-like protein
MGLDNFDAAVAHSFGIEIDGIQIKHFMEVSDLKVEHNTTDLISNTADGKRVIRRLNTGGKPPGEITVTRGFSEDRGFSDWFSKVGKGLPGARKGGAIIVFDYSGKEIARWTFSNAFPKSYSTGGLKAGDTNVLTEKVTIVFEDLEIK